MPFTIIESPDQLIIGFSTPIVVPSNPSEFPAMSDKKLQQLEVLKKDKAQLMEYALDTHFYAVNNASSGDPNYLVGVKASSKGPNQESFTVPTGSYAIFKTTVKNRIEADQFIGASYGEVYQSAEFQINGNFNVEVVDDFIQDSAVEFSVWIPVADKVQFKKNKE